MLCFSILSIICLKTVGRVLHHCVNRFHVYHEVWTRMSLSGLTQKFQSKWLIEGKLFHIVAMVGFGSILEKIWRTWTICELWKLTAKEDEMSLGLEFCTKKKQLFLIYWGFSNLKLFTFGGSGLKPESFNLVFSIFQTNENFFIMLTTDVYKAFLVMAFMRYIFCYSNNVACMDFNIFINFSLHSTMFVFVVWILWLL